VVFIGSRVFSRRLLALGKDGSAEVLSAIQSDLLANPVCGRVVQGLGGIRKARAADPGRGKGKRGGFRYLYLYFASHQEIYLLYLFDKDEREELSPDERKLLRDLAAQCKR
jgi:RelE toxin of RelE / RelB toxin-antitoxin system